MQHTHSHEAHIHHNPSIQQESRKQNINLAIIATLHCLLGCGIGEVVGMIIATYFGMSMAGSMITGIFLGFIFGFAFGTIPLMKKGLSFSKSFKIIFIAEGLSIIVMEGFEAGTQFFIPGVLNATLTDSIFWIGMLVSLAVGFIAALPVNYYMIKRGVRHQH